MTFLNNKSIKIPPLSYTEKALIKLTIFSTFLTSIFLAVYYLNNLSIIEAISILLGLFVAQFIFSIVLGQRIRRRVIFESRFRQRLKKLRDRLALNQRSHNQIKDHLFESVIIIDDQSRIISANRAAKKLLKSKKSLKQLSLVEVIRVPEIHELILAARAKKTTLLDKVTMGLDNPIKLMVRASPMGVNLMLSMLDITKASIVDEKHHYFIAHASHELKTPISVILANAELLMDAVPDDKNRPLLQAIFRQAVRAKKLLESLLDLLTLNTGRDNLSLNPIYLSAFIDDIKRSLGHLGQKIKNDIHASVVIISDHSLLEKLALIIIENAQKYAGINATICIKAVPLKNKVKIQFIDNGPGIKPHLKERVFETFYRQPQHNRSDTEGFGLGLSHARAIANSMGGKIFIEDMANQGCCVSLLLDQPLSKQAGAQVGF